jgi:hypothetical protein
MAMLEALSPATAMGMMLRSATYMVLLAEDADDRGSGGGRPRRGGGGGGPL